MLVARGQACGTQCRLHLEMMSRGARHGHIGATRVRLVHHAHVLKLGPRVPSPCRLAYLQGNEVELNALRIGDGFLPVDEYPVLTPARNNRRSYGQM